MCITDADACFLDPDYGTKIEKVVNDYGHIYGLIGCLTNRLGGSHQCYKGHFNEDMNTMNHRAIPLELWEKNGTRVDETTGVAGVFMLFNKDTWKKAGGFREGIITTDTHFNKSIKRLRLKIGLAKGIYIFHNYRLSEHGQGQKKAQQSIKHLS